MTNSPIKTTAPSNRQDPEEDEEKEEEEEEEEEDPSRVVPVSGRSLCCCNCWCFAYTILLREIGTPSYKNGFIFQFGSLPNFDLFPSALGGKGGETSGRIGGK